MKIAKHNINTRHSLDNYQDYFDSDKDIELTKNKFASDLDCFCYKL